MKVKIMNHSTSTIVLLISIFFLLAACGGEGETIETVQRDQIDQADTADLTTDLTTLPDVIDVETAASLQSRDDVVIVDVREQWEYDEAHVPGVLFVPMSELESRVAEIPANKTVILMCHSGGRSGRVHAYLEQLGYETVHNMAGGIVAWQAAGLAVE